MSLVYGIQHCQALKWRGDEHLEAMQIGFLEVVSLQRTPLPSANLAEILYNYLRNSKVMANDLAAYRRQLVDNEMPADKRYDYLMRMWNRHIVEMKFDKNDGNLLQAIGNPGKGNPHLAGGVTTQPKKPCKFWGTAEGCNKGKSCPFAHSGPAKAKSKAGANPRSQSPKGDPKEYPCFKHSMGMCPRSAKECKFSHRNLKPDEQPAFERFKKRVGELKTKNKTAAGAVNKDGTGQDTAKRERTPKGKRSKSKKGKKSGKRSQSPSTKEPAPAAQASTS